MAEEKEITQWYCERCKTTMKVDNFYKSNNLEKYPYGYLNQCKKCIGAGVDNFNPNTFLWILQECDVPYIPRKWDEIITKVGERDPRKTTKITVLGKYLSTMKLNQYKNKRWSDTELLQKLEEKKTIEAMERQGKTHEEISETLSRQDFSLDNYSTEQPVYLAASAAPADSPEEKEDSHLASGNEDYFAEQGAGNDDEADLVGELTDEDKRYLRLKWGNTYRPSEWIKLEDLYNKMYESYDIQTEGHKDTLKKVCRASLKADQLLDIGDMDGAQKAVKMYDTLMKSGKFTAAQNKAEKGEYVDSVSELVAICETKGFIPKYYVDGPQDKVDRTIQDIESWTRTLIMEETNLGSMIEKAVKDIQEQKEKEAQENTDEEDEDEILENQIFEEDGQSFLTDQDFSEFSNFEEDNAAADDEYLSDLLESGEIE